MGEPVSRYDVSAMEKNYKKITEPLLLHILKLIEESGRKIEKQVKVCVKNENGSSTKMVEKNNVDTALNPKEAQLVEQALTKGSKFKGVVTIYVGKEKILDVVNGQVYTDRLNLVQEKNILNPTQQIPTKKQALVEIKSNSPQANQLVENVQELIHLLRKEGGIKKGDYSPIPSSKYHFWEKDGEVAITNKNSGEELFNNFGLTDKATNADRINFQKIPAFTAQLKQEREERERMVIANQVITNAAKVRL